MKLYELKAIIDNFVETGKGDLDVFVCDKDDTLVNINYLQTTSPISNECVYIRVESQ